ncbi:hypothetical protein CAPTEDRAFT_228821 [Capitella teleta]|uniref:Large ribosomal subunit protein bL9m n=1 Tax=Capitella teleta TaxID=283909 RepID=R7TNU1_CAPTE|nr:hypothetical protein CAPTEDRAFT_228821 [Capitella teleta]|eukprot:ELT93206.1 hypothetical protein CAPTEDRAFT_228821 [Capitella teleta]
MIFCTRRASDIGHSTSARIMFPRTLQPCLLPLVNKCCLQQSQRTAVVVSRQFPPKIYKKDLNFGPFRPNLKKREWVYRFEKDTTSEPAGNMQLILTVDIEGIGFKGETVTVSKRVGRNYLLISGAAVYVTPENLAKWAEIRKNLPKTVTQSIWARKTMRRLSEMNLPIPMHPRHPWTLSPAHVVVAFRKQGVELNDHASFFQRSSRSTVLQSSSLGEWQRYCGNPRTHLSHRPRESGRSS